MNWTNSGKLPKRKVPFDVPPSLTLPVVLQNFSSSSQNSRGAREFRHPKTFAPPEKRLINYAAVSLTDSVYGDIKSIKYASKIDENGPAGIRESTQLELERLIFKMLALCPGETCETAVNFLRRIAKKAARLNVEVSFKIDTSPQIFFSAATPESFSNMRLRGDLKKQYAPVINGERQFGENFFTELRFGRPNHNVNWGTVNFRWRDSEELFLRKHGSSPPELNPDLQLQNSVPCFQLTQSEMSGLISALRTGRIGINSVKQEVEPNSEQVYELLNALFQHSPSKDAKKIVSYLNSLVKLAQSEKALLVFSIAHKNNKPDLIYFSILDIGEFLQNACIGILPKGRIKAFPPVVPGTDNRLVEPGIFTHHNLP